MTLATPIDRASERAAGAAQVAADAVTLVVLFVAVVLLAGEAVDLGASAATVAAVLVGVSATLALLFGTAHGVLGAVAVTVTAGVLQGPAAALVGGGPILLIDDVALGVAFAVALAVALRHRQYAPLLVLGAAAVLVLVGLSRADERTTALYLARQVTVPVVLMFCGYIAAATAPRGVPLLANRAAAGMLGPTLWVVASAVALYMVLEWLGIRIFDPLATRGVDGVAPGIVVRAGLPGNYFFNPGDGQELLIRLGGPFLNPPVAGLFTAAVAVWVLWSAIARRAVGLSLLFLALAVTTVGTFSRGGLLILVAGIGFVVLYRRLGLLGALLVLGVAGAYGGVQAAQQGDSITHYNGLVNGLIRTVEQPLGEGFGTFGNATNPGQAAYEGEGESLAAIAFVALGWPALLAYVGALAAALRTLTRGRWEGGLATAVLVCCLFTESLSSLAGAAACWVLVGVALAGARGRIAFGWPAGRRRRLEPAA